MRENGFYWVKTKPLKAYEKTEIELLSIYCNKWLIGYYREYPGGISFWSLPVGEGTFFDNHFDAIGDKIDIPEKYR
jgi:hypothetical protein